MIFFACFVSICFIHVAYAEERLVYAEVFGNSYQPNLELFEVSPTHPNHKPKMVYSSDRIMSQGRMMMTASKSRVFIRAAEVKRTTAYEYKNHGIYEMMIDGSNRYRLLFPFSQIKDVVHMAASHHGDYIALYTYEDYPRSKAILYIYDANTGKQMSRIDLSDMSGDCLPYYLGWLPNDQSLFFTMDVSLFPTGDDHKIAGTYLLNINNHKMTKLPKDRTIFSFDKSKTYFSTPRMIGVIKRGLYLFLLGGAETPYYTANIKDGEQKELHLSAENHVMYPLISHTGDYLSFLEMDSTPGGRNHTIWIKNLVTNTNMKLSQVSALQKKNRIMIGWLDDDVKKAVGNVD